MHVYVRCNTVKTFSINFNNVCKKYLWSTFSLFIIQEHIPWNSLQPNIKFKILQNCKQICQGALLLFIELVAIPQRWMRNLTAKRRSEIKQKLFVVFAITIFAMARVTSHGSFSTAKLHWSTARDTFWVNSLLMRGSIKTCWRISRLTDSYENMHLIVYNRIML